MLISLPDTNIIISAEKGGQKSPNKEYFERVFKDEFELVYSEDTIKEYLKKLDFFEVSETRINEILNLILRKGREVDIEFFHFER